MCPRMMTVCRERKVLYVVLPRARLASRDCEALAADWRPNRYASVSQLLRESGAWPARARSVLMRSPLSRTFASTKGKTSARSVKCTAAPSARHVIPAAGATPHPSSRTRGARVCAPMAPSRSSRAHHSASTSSDRQSAPPVLTAPKIDWHANSRSKPIEATRACVVEVEAGAVAKLSDGAAAAGVRLASGAGASSSLSSSAGHQCLRWAERRSTVIAAPHAGHCHIVDRAAVLASCCWKANRRAFADDGGDSVQEESPDLRRRSLLGSQISSIKKY